MAYSIDYFYNKFLDRIDKQGSNTVNLPRVMEMLVTHTYGFLESIINFNEINQKQRDMVQPLSKSYSWLLAVNPSDNKELFAALPNDYYHFETVIPQIPGKTVRETRFVRKGELEPFLNNSLRKPTDEYPIVVQYSDTVALYGSTVLQGVKLRGFYLTKPVFGNYGGDTSVEIAVNLPDHSVEKIMQMMAADYLGELGDPRYQPKNVEVQQYGKQ